MIDKIKSFFKSFLLRWKTEENLIKTCNRATPLHRKVSNSISCVFIVIAIIVWLFSFPSSAEEGVTPFADAPADLNGVTVSFPEDHTFSRYLGGYVDISGILTNQGYSTVFNNQFSGIYNSSSSSIAFLFNDTSTENYLSIGGGVYEVDALYGELISITFNGGTDTANSSFIQWLVDNDATFDDGSEPNPLVTFNKGLYKVSSTWYNSDISTQLDGMEFYSLSEGDLFTALTVQNDELIFDDENGDMHVMARNTTTGAKWIDNSGQFVYFLNDESIPQSLANQIPTLLEYISDVTLIEFQRMQDSWYYGVQDGFTEGYNQASRDTEGTFLGNIFGGVFDALDKFQMFGQFSFLDFIKSLIGILALIWFLRLLAGG